jgi:hypothetical protein
VVNKRTGIHPERKTSDDSDDDDDSDGDGVI